MLNGKRMIVEIQTFDFGERRQGVNAFFTSGTKQLQCGHHVHFRVIKFRDRRRIHHVAVIHFHRIGVSGGDMAEAGDVFIQFHLHHAVFFQRVHFAGFGFTRFDKAQRFRDRHLENQDLIFLQRRFRNTVTGLDQAGFHGFPGRFHSRDALEKFADRHGIGGVIRALVDHLQHIFFADHAGSELDPAGAPAVRHRHLATGERHLITGDRHGFEDPTSDHAFGLFVEITVVVAGDRLGCIIVHWRSPVLSWRAGVLTTPVRPGNRLSAAI
ncbi:hypothetical protein SRABI106_03758 [Rahnella aquatilis]|nr:hypothetical protein SRABI106_03758 [Rahnella aquatilis]